MDNNLKSEFGVANNENIVSEVPKNRHIVRMVFVTLIMLALLSGGFFLATNNNVKSQFVKVFNPDSMVIEEIASKQTPKIPQSQIVDRQVPWYEMKSAKAVFMQNETVELYVSAFSGGKDVVAYDVLLGVDKTQFDIIDITSELPDFTIQKFDNETFQSVTGYKNPSIKEDTIFSDTTFLKLTLKPKMKGDFVVSVFNSQGNESSKMMDKDVNIITPQIGSVLVKVE